MKPPIPYEPTIKVSAKVFEGLLFLKNEGLFLGIHRHKLAGMAEQFGYKETAEWIRANEGAVLLAMLFKEVEVV
jgi:hypothetical protein